MQIMDVFVENWDVDQLVNGVEIEVFLDWNEKEQCDELDWIGCKVDQRYIVVGKGLEQDSFISCLD